MVKMVDRFTTSLNLFPSGPVTETLEALITVVKVIGHGALNDLDGLAAMRPDGAFLRTLNQGGQACEAYHAVAGDYEAKDEGLRALLTGAANAVVDRVFEQVSNDLVVPEPRRFTGYTRPESSEQCRGHPHDDLWLPAGER